MDATTGERANLSYGDAPPVLVAGSSETAIRRARSAIDNLGLRVGAALPVATALERFEQQASAGAVWIELDEDCGGAMDALLSHVARDVSDGRYAAVVATVPGLLDPVMAAVGLSAVEVIVSPDALERAAALAIAASAHGRPLRLSDVAADRSAEQLRQLSDEVSRIAAMLSRLSTGPDPAPRAIQPPASGEVRPVSPDTVRKVIRARRLRARFFPEDMFADPAWDMLLDLLQAELSHLRVPVSSLCIAAAVPATTALRWLKTMVSEGLFIRRADPHDGRRVFVELAPETRDALHLYFAEVEEVAVI